MDNNGITIPFRFSDNLSMRFLNGSQFYLERDILRIAFSIFKLEKDIKEGKIIEKIKIPLSLSTFLKVNNTNLSEELSGLISYVLMRNIKIKFVPYASKKYKKKSKVKFNNYENICLFSGGIDSLSGIIESKKQLKNVCGIFIAHSDQAGTIKVVNNLMRSFLSPNGIDIKKIYAPPMKMMGYSQMRGFLYILSSSIYANIFQSKNIVVSECGPTMYQPKFGPFDSITLTSNPILIEKTKNIIETLLNREIKIILPFEDMTKAEVLMLMPKELMKDTFSCISQRFRIHDGVCYGCIIRRLAGIITGHNDAIYKYDVFGNGTSHVENLLSLLRFSYDMLFDISDTLPFAEYIEEYNKLDLFKRFAIDNLLALNILIESRYNFNKYVKNFLKNNEFPNNNFFEKRRKDILSNKLKPNFNI